jgi:hypothetical protein
VLSESGVNTRKGFSMGILNKRSILKLAATFMVVAIMVTGAFAMHSKAAIAASCGSAIFGMADCDMTVTATATGVLEFSNDATVAVSPVTVGHNPFTFASAVIDSRTTPAGWQLQAVSTGLANTTNIAAPNIPMTIGGTVNTVASTCIIGVSTTCTGFTGTTITLPGSTESTPQTFAAETNADGSGIYTLSTAGNFDVANTTPGGDYSATITLSLLTSFT